MDLKIKISTKKIFNILYLFILIINIIALLWIFNFSRKYIYGSIVVDQNFLQSQTIKPGSDLDMEKFNEIVQGIENKQQKRNTDNIKNVFN
ncbi:MAG TPA: hypothetical protein PLH29_04235 [bacterium]|nr:hypothetical protein [bacterium]